MKAKSRIKALSGIFLLIFLPMLIWAKNPQVKYDKLLFKRDGGGNKVFYVTLKSKPYEIVFRITRLNFRDTTITFSVFADDTLKEMYDTLRNLFSGKVSISGDFRQPKLLTGTWVRIYVLRNGKKKMIEITEPMLREKLMKLEEIVVKHTK